MIFYILIGMLIMVGIIYGSLLIIKEYREVKDPKPSHHMTEEEELYAIDEIETELDEMLNKFNDPKKGK